MLSDGRLAYLGLHPTPHDPGSLQRSYAQLNTRLSFRQTKYNLLRESSEGFAGLIVLLISGGQPAAEKRGGQSDVDRQAAARVLWEKVTVMIGSFDLSPPRVLDLLLEVASCQLAEAWKFWLEVLRSSPWGLEAAVRRAKADSRNERSRSELNQDPEEWEVCAKENCRELAGNRVLAQVLGVKFAFCQVSPLVSLN